MVQGMPDQAERLDRARATDGLDARLREPRWHQSVARVRESVARRIVRGEPR